LRRQPVPVVEVEREQRGHRRGGVDSHRAYVVRLANHFAMVGVAFIRAE
jgi:hypothetical protein